jgi:hypothetical protein
VCLFVCSFLVEFSAVSPTAMTAVSSANMAMVSYIFSLYFTIKRVLNIGFMKT